MDGLFNPPPPVPVAATISAIPGTRNLCPDHLVLARDPATPPGAPQGGPCDHVIHLDRLQLTFDDEFDSLRLYNPRTNQGVWKTSFAHGPQTGAYAWDSRTLRGNHEQEIYVDPDFPGLGVGPTGVKPFSVKDGVLTITADHTPDAIKWKLWGFAYTSGLLITQPTFSQQYGYFEMRARLPAGKGVWPAFWLLSEDATWPPELDILEQTGDDTIYQTVHTAQDGAPEETGFKVDTPGATTGFHTYGALWTPDRVVWFIDGKQTASAATPADMRKPMYILLNLAIGGGMTGDPAPQTAFPARYSLDYVRVYALQPAQHGPPPAKHAAGDHHRHAGE